MGKRLRLAGLFLAAFAFATSSDRTEAETYNACGIEYDTRDKKLVDGDAVVVRGKLKIEVDGTLTYVRLTNDRGSCEVELLTNPEETAAAKACGNGQTVTIIGRITTEFFVPMVDPATISCG